MRIYRGGKEKGVGRVVSISSSSSGGGGGGGWW